LNWILFLITSFVPFLFQKQKLSVNWSFPIHFLIWVFTNLSNDGINLCLCSWIIFISYYENSLLG
jgi:hypothetical protein